MLGVFNDFSDKPRPAFVFILFRVTSITRRPSDYS